MSAAKPKSRWRFIGIALAAILLYSIGLAIGPRVSGDALDALAPDGARLNCLTAIKLPGPFGVLLNCDSPDFMESAAQPRRLLDKGNWRQNRPGQIWLAWLISKPIGAFGSVFVAIANRGDIGLPQGAKRSRAQAMLDLAPGFVAYYLINVALLVGSLLLLRSMARLSGLDIAAFGLAGALLLFNDVTKAYLLTPHSQLMNILVPIVLVSILFRFVRGGGISVARLLVISAVVGLGVLAYATWLLVPVVLLMAIVLSRFAGAGAWEAGRRALPWWPVCLALTVVPYLIWYQVVIKVAGSFYQHEMTYDHGLVWVFQGPVLAVASRFLGNLAYLLGEAAGQARPYLAFLAPSLIVLGMRRVRLSAEDRSTLIRAVVCAAAVSLLFLVFFGLLGFNKWRYAVPLLPAWVLPIGVLSASVARALPTARQQTVFRASLVAVAIGIAVVEVAKEGPWG